MTDQLLRNEYPRPQFVREEWMSLNGEWDFDYDDQGIGEREAWYEEHDFTSKIIVPFCYQSRLSGIGDTAFHDTVWYRKVFSVPEAYRKGRLLLHFGAVDYEAKVWVNGKLVALHEGGHTPFHADITDVLAEGDNTVVVKAVDHSRDVTLPRGKQFWEEKSAGIFYTRTTGIWQSVWLEPVSDTCIGRIRLTPDIDVNDIAVDVFLSGYRPGALISIKASVTFKGEFVAEDTFSFRHESASRRIHLEDFNDHGLGRWWTPEKPNLYDLELTLSVDGVLADTVSSYFGMRKISIEDGKLLLNNRTYFMKMVLDQGYFPEGILTAPSDDDLRRDVELTKEMGFNGARKHQKIEDPRYLYWADRLGLLVWGEMANAYQFSGPYVARITKEWIQAVERDYNHPCIVAWVPLNESWGVPNILVDKQQQQHALSLYHMTKSLDLTRPVISNDGWELVNTDLVTVHDYEWRREVLTDRYATKEAALSAQPGNRWIMVPGFPYSGQPILATEFGGISFKKNEWEGWGYSGAVNEEDFTERLRNVVEPMLQSPIIQGFCYTQFTDVEQEINGLLTYDRKPKLPLETIRAIVEGTRK
ncbi:glycoside hydrolase family 2 [Paenibacillus sp. Marseille-P2973]|uniref:glycoside hydrolase family 2 protein n=1 Tax=Paenibacillus TaxID=44249 RepID=UPI001B38B79B|nr:MULTISPECIES: sugar-binding domain-containing protein [Paenibacillus]MBQ4901076.1 glycoside hydrolase family 2 [Paenibacillus sp. Marseille-P2973]MDN4068191.1 glycoside hydrolase family 2 TIM barrel-domain containing protein [Paenibacillus vini]